MSWNAAIGPLAGKLLEMGRPLRHVILFTFHAYATWMPDRRQGYYENRAGLHQRDPEQAEQYRARQQEAAAELLADVQRALIEELFAAAEFQRFRLFAAATDDEHLHLVAGWDDARTPEDLQETIKESISRRLNADFGKRRWLGRNGHDRRVRDAEHFLQLRDEYLPSHRGWRWERLRGWTPPGNPPATC